MGSPPPMRGKVALFERTPHELRITPAYAGKSAQVRQCQGSSRDHPRLCGEKTLNRKGQTRNLGSPPPMRGKACCVMPAFSRSRITPAYAGKSAQIEQAKFVLQDHPRLCGEKKSFRGKLQSRIGSPPPMRGKGNAWDWFFTGTRITPAYAGKRLIMYIMCGRIRDHPRLCGEKHSTFVIRSRRLGSPPPMRGKVSAISWAYKSGWITPAYAGKRSTGLISTAR